MVTVADVHRFERGAGDSKRLFTEGAGAFDAINSHIAAVEAAMMEEFGCDRPALETLCHETRLGPKAEACLRQAVDACFTDPLSAAKATALRWEDAIDEWRKEAKRRGASHIVVGNDSFDYEDYPLYARSPEEASAEEQRLKKTAGVHHVVTIVL